MNLREGRALQYVQWAGYEGRDGMDAVRRLRVRAMVCLPLVCLLLCTYVRTAHFCHEFANWMGMSAARCELGI